MLTPELVAHVELVAGTEGSSVSAVVREAIEHRMFCDNASHAEFMRLHERLDVLESTCACCHCSNAIGKNWRVVDVRGDLGVDDGIMCERCAADHDTDAEHESKGEESGA
jgi:hypothetical protein